MSGPGGIVEELVHQFTDPFAFYRELIQNSIDAGSTRIEVRLTYRPGAGKGLALIEVADWGEGMNRQIIEDYLVTKFRSTKENDLTKIGKFGIGFVSIFACAPDAVTVDTGRDGESWRVLFRADTTWELLRLDEPVEGTRVTLHKQLAPTDYRAFVERSKDALSRWCKHSDVDVVFSAGATDGSAPPPPSAVREPLVVDAPFQVEHLEDGTHIIAGPARRSPPRTGMYNRGLTLLETDEVLIPGVTLKIVSRYLEHTLTRDNVRRDRHFSRALDLARALVKDKLLAQLPAELEKAALSKSGADDWAALFLFARERLRPAQLTYRLVGGGAVKHADLVDAVKPSKTLTVSPQRTLLVQRLLDAKLPVLDVTWGTELGEAVCGAVGAKQTRIADEHFTYAAPPDRATPREFASALVELLVDAGAQIDQVELSEVRGAAADQPWVLLESLSQPLPFQQARSSAFQRKAPKVLCFNLAHEAVGRAVPLLHRAPRLAALLLARLVLVSAARLDAARDATLTRWALS